MPPGGLLAAGGNIGLMLGLLIGGSLWGRNYYHHGPGMMWGSGFPYGMHTFGGGIGMISGYFKGKTDRVFSVLTDSLLNKGSAFSPEERVLFELEGMLPFGVTDRQLQQQRAYEYVHERGDEPLAKYLNMMSLQDRNETLFYQVLAAHVDARGQLAHDLHGAGDFVQALALHAQGSQKCPDPRHGLGEGCKVNVNCVLNTLLLTCSGTRLTQSSETMRVIDQQTELVFVFQGHNVLQVTLVARHTKYSFSNHQYSSTSLISDLLRALKLFLQVLYIVMRENKTFTHVKTNAVNDTCM